MGCGTAFLPIIMQDNDRNHPVSND